VPFYELVEQIVELFALNAQKGQAPYLYAFLDAVITFLEENIPDIATFLKYWDEKLHEQSIPSAAAKGVRILTIHKSKGLDFHTVFIPYCNWDIEKDRISDLLWVEPEESPYNKIPLLPIALDKKTANSIYAPHYVQEHISRRVESLNIGYVAFTRPRQNIVVIAPYKGSNTFREVLAAALWRTTQENDELKSCLSISHLGHMPEDDEANSKKNGNAPTFATDGELLFEWGTPSHLECETDSVKKEKTNPLLFDPAAETVQYALNDRKVQVVQSNSAHLFNARLLEDADTHGEIEQLEARRRGEMLHAILEKVDTADQVEAAVNRFAAEGRLVDNADAATVIQQLTEALAQPAAREWFDGSWSLYRERNILRKGKMPQRPDRVMERNGETVVVDYKFGAPHRRHHEQVQQYCALLTQMGRRNVRGFVWYVYTGRIDPVELEPELFQN
jgi:uvrD/REP helicase domain-containing protein